MLYFVSGLQVQLRDHVERLRERAGSSQPDRVFDDDVLDTLYFKAPRIVQEAILHDARHSGYVDIRFSAFLCRCSVLLLYQESLGVSAIVARSHDFYLSCPM